MRILFLNHNVACSGGTFFRAYDIARYLVRRGHELTLLTISAHRRWGFKIERSKGVDIIHTPDLFWGGGRTGWDPWDTLNRILFLKNQTWDIVHAWDSRPVVVLPGLFARRRSSKSGCRLVMDWCDWWGRGGTQAERPGKWAKLLYVPIETYFEEAFRTRADGTTVISKALHDRAIALGVPARSIRILPQGCDVEAPPFTDRVAARKHLGLPATHPVIVSVGAMTTSEAKLLADTLRLLFRRRPDCSFFLIGGHRYHFPEEVLKARQFTQTGFVPDAVLRNYMSACDALLAPISDTIASRARWPSKVNPFLAAGRATIITRVGDLACLLEREQAALVARDQPEEIVDGLIRLLDDPGLRQHYEVQARRVAEGLLRWDLLAANVEDLYHIVRGEKSQGCTSSNRQDRQTHRNAVTRTGIRHQGVRKYVPVTFPA